MRKKIAWLTALAFSLLFVFACKDLIEKLAVDKIEVTPANSEKNVGETQAFTAKAYDTAGGFLATATFTWASSDATVASVNAGGIATAMQGGNAHISATCSGKTASGLLFVNPIASMHNSRSFEWYRSQMGTGPASGNNCGPTTTHMAIRWYRNTLTDIPSVEEIRNRHPRDNGWWYTTDISESLRNYGIPFANHPVSAGNIMFSCLDRGHVLLICLNMQLLTYDRHPFYDRYRPSGTGHFMIIKGYSSDKQYFIAYDPSSWSDDNYPDGSPMGRNRYYKKTELVSAMVNWWAYAFEIGASSATSTVDLASIPVGRSGPDEI